MLGAGSRLAPWECVHGQFVPKESRVLQTGSRSTLSSAPFPSRIEPKMCFWFRGCDTLVSLVESGVVESCPAGT